MRDPYSILGVRRNAGPDEIKAAWRAVAKNVHPDQNRDDPLATARFAEAGRAYEVLKDPKLRSRYDHARREAELRRMEAMKPKPRESEPADDAAEPEVAEEMISRIFGGAGRTRSPDARPSEARQPPARPPEPKAPEAKAPEPKPAAARAEPAGNPRADVPPTPMDDVRPHAPFGMFRRTAAPAAELVSSIVRRIRGQASKAMEKVPDLAVEIAVRVEDIHWQVKVSVALPEGESLKVAIPQGATDGHVIRLKDQGYSVPGMKRGDLVVTLRVAQDGAFRTDGYDLRTTLPVNIQNAVLGCEMIVQTLDGPVAVTVPAWSGSDHVIAIADRGLADANGVRGKLFVELRLMLWEKPDEKMTDLMRSLREGLYL